MLRRDLFKKVFGTIAGGTLLNNSNQGGFVPGELLEFDPIDMVGNISFKGECSDSGFKIPLESNNVIYDAWQKTIRDRSPQENEFVSITYISMDKEI